ncbi:hypothetical protein H0E87_031674 [Populus deltoides]|uniref:Uncharacterized protein n=1 Tax=Populus deltoides TaxID=3696 RepID=A0A8T2WDB1_POPDE|nr:hypothetical protein H0E87_031674 [Populus deltoides]
METSIGMPVPTMEMLGSRIFLITFVLTNGYNSTSIAHRTRQASEKRNHYQFILHRLGNHPPGFQLIEMHGPKFPAQRKNIVQYTSSSRSLKFYPDVLGLISSELVNLTSQQHGSTPQKKRSNDVLFTQNNPTADDISNDLNEQSIRNAVERTVQASNLYLAKAWFHSSQPMTRSRSSELRRRYAAMQYTQTNIGMEVMQNASGHGVNNLNQEFGNPNGFNDPPVHDTANQLGTFMSPTNSSSSTFNTPQMSSIDKVSSVVNMLKGTLERKKLGNQIEKEMVEDSSNAFYHAQVINSTFDQRKRKRHSRDSSWKFSRNITWSSQDPEFLQTVQGPMDLDFEGFVNTINPVPAEHGKQIGNGRSLENGSRAKDFRDRIIDNLKDDRKMLYCIIVSLCDHITLSDHPNLCSGQGDPTKKRRVERSRKMAEAKERNMTPAIPSDMQSVLKRCENLEKEVRSLKLNLSFMNRKDSEQTKQIEELQKQNEDLTDEKERLLEEIERILAETGKM